MNTLKIPQPPGYLNLPAFERRRIVSDLNAIIRRAEAAGCVVKRDRDDVTITVPDGVAFDLRGLR